MKEIKAEIITFSKLIENSAYKNKSTADFWLNKSQKLPIIIKLAKKCLNIPSSSSFIEQHFSIAGYINDQRRGNMSNEEIEDRSMKITSNL